MFVFYKVVSIELKKSLYWFDFTFIRNDLFDQLDATIMIC